jgi:hypothetical protein
MELFNVELPEIRAAYCDFMKHVLWKWRYRPTHSFMQPGSISIPNEGYHSNHILAKIKYLLGKRIQSPDGTHFRIPG